MALVKESMPSQLGNVRLVWRVTAVGTEPANSQPIPTVISKRWCVIVARQGSGTITLKGGIYVPEAPETVYWDTVLSQTVSANSTVITELTGFPYHFYRVEFNSGNSGPFDIFVVVEGSV